MRQIVFDAMCHLTSNLLVWVMCKGLGSLVSLWAMTVDGLGARYRDGSLKRSICVTGLVPLAYSLASTIA